MMLFEIPVFVIVFFYRILFFFVMICKQENKFMRQY